MPSISSAGLVSRNISSEVNASVFGGAGLTPGREKTGRHHPGFLGLRSGRLQSRLEVTRKNKEVESGPAV